MLPLDDPRWRTYRGGYRVPYDASIPIKQLLDEGASAAIWKELWNELHHQGDVDSASYAAVPWVLESIRRSAKLDWNALALIATIEIERPANPEVPAELAKPYVHAIRSLPNVVGAHPDQDWDELVLRGAIACIALARGQPWFAQAYFELDRATANQWFSQEFGWELGNSKDV